MVSREKVKSAQIKNNFVVCGCMLASAERDVVLPWAKKRNVSMFRSDINSFNQGCCSALYSIHFIYFGIMSSIKKASSNKILAELMVNMDVVRMIVVSCQE